MAIAISAALSAAGISPPTAAIALDQKLDQILVRLQQRVHRLGFLVEALHALLVLEATREIVEQF